MTSLATKDFDLVSLVFDLTGGERLRIDNLGEEFRILSSLICCRMLWFDDVKGNGVEVRS